MPELKNKPTLADFQKYVSELEIERGFSDQSIIDKCLLMGEEVGEHFKAVGYTIDDLRITLSRNGDVAWWYCKLDDINEWKGQSCSWLDARWTGVLEKHDDRWQIRQMHFSYAEEKK